MNRRLIRACAVLAAGGLSAIATSFGASATDPAIGTRQCPDGYTGAVITVDGHDVMACQNVAAVESCPSGQAGVHVTVNGRGVYACAAKIGT